MIGKFHLFHKKTGEVIAGTTDRKSSWNLFYYIQRETADGITVCNDFCGTDDRTAMLDIIDELYGHSKVRLRLRHITLEAHPEDTVYDGHEYELAQALKEKFGLWKVYGRRHRDKKHPHIHFAALEIDDRFHCVDYSHAAERIRELAEELERKYGGIKTGRNREHELAHQSYTKNELERGERLHREGKRKTPCPDKMVLKARVDLLVACTGSIDELVSEARKDGVSVIVSQHANGRGVSFSDGKATARGSAIGWPYAKLEETYHARGQSQSAGITGGDAGGRGEAATAPGRAPEEDRGGARTGPEDPFEGLGGPQGKTGFLGLLFLLQLFLRIIGRSDWKDRQFWKLYMAPRRGVAL
jgi:hypothetical protein